VQSGSHKDVLLKITTHHNFAVVLIKAGFLSSFVFS